MTNILIIFVVVISALIGGTYGWRRAKTSIRTPPQKYNFPGGMTQFEDFRRRALKHRQLRLPLTLLYAAGGGLRGFILLTASATFLWR